MLEDTYQKTYKMRRVGDEGQNVVVSVPPEVIEKEARKHNLTIKEFTEQFRVIAQFNSFEGIHYTFEKTPDENMR